MVVASKKEPSACEEIKRLNHNVRLILVIVLFAGLSESLGFGSALSAYLFKITGKENINVGYLESAMGITKLLTALPVGSISDKYGRAPVGRVGSFAYTAASAMTAYCLVANAMSRGGSAGSGGAGDGSRRGVPSRSSCSPSVRGGAQRRKQPTPPRRRQSPPWTCR